MFLKVFSGKQFSDQSDLVKIKRKWVILVLQSFQFLFTEWKDFGRRVEQITVTS